LVFSSSESAEAERASIEAALPGLGQWRGRLNDPAAIRAALDARSAMRARVARISMWANMRVTRNGADSVAAADLATAGALWAKLEAATAYMEPELVGLGEGRLKSLAESAALKLHKLTLDRLRARGPRVLPTEQESLIAGLKPLLGAPTIVRDVFTNVEMPWPSITVKGENRRLSPGAYGRTLADPDRGTRKAAWEAFAGTQRSFKGTHAALLSAYLSNAAWEAKLRGWPSQVDMLTADDPLPAGAFQALTIEAETAARGPLERYAALKARILGLPALASFDLAAPISADNKQYSIDEAKALTLAAVTPLGEEYRARLAKGLAGRWMDWRPGPAKAPGGTTFYVSPEMPAFLALSFTGNFQSVSLLAHEWGHWMHWDYARTSGQPFELLLPPTSLGDTAPFVHEMLLADRMIATAPDREARIVAIANAIERLRTTYYAVIAQASFDLALRQAADRSEPMDSDRISELYCVARKRFSPPSIAWDARDCLNWVTEPYVYFDLYFYRYLLATSASAFVAEEVARGSAVKAQRFKDLLRSGGSNSAATLLATVGFDASRAQSYSAMTRRMTRLVDSLARELEARNK
jgi:oligoendopeptidase F